MDWSMELIISTLLDDGAKTRMRRVLNRKACCRDEFACFKECFKQD